MAENDIERTADWFRRFADAEGRESPRYRDWALGIADDIEILALIARLPLAKRQPVLILSCARLAGVPLRSFDSVRGDMLALWSRIADYATTHSTQTNDPRRCTPLLVALARIPGPLALVEVGASAGLTLFPDRYAYRWTAPGRVITVEPGAGSTVVCDAEVRGWGANTPKLPTVVYREGIDLNPLDVTNPDDREWLEALVWPEQSERLSLIRAAADVVANDPPRMTAGDACAEIRGAVARARRASPLATVVVLSPAVLVYLDPAERHEFAKYCRRANVRWVSIDGRGVLPDIAARADELGLDGDFILSLDGEPIAAVDPLGRSLTLHNTSGLTAEEVDFIEFERTHWGPVRSKESLVRREWKLPLVRYYQKLYGIMESKAAAIYDPVLVRSFRETRQKAPR